MAAATDAQLQELAARLIAVENWQNDTGRSPPQYTFPITVQAVEARIGHLEGVANNVLTNVVAPQLHRLEIDAGVIRNKVDHTMVPAMEQLEIIIASLEQMHTTLLQQLNTEC